MKRTVVHGINGTIHFLKADRPTASVNRPAGKVAITYSETWDHDAVRRVCIENELFNAGSNGAYMELFGFIDTHEPTPQNIWTAAAFIASRTASDDGDAFPVSPDYVAFLLSRDAVSRLFTS